MANIGEGGQKFPLRGFSEAYNQAIVADATIQFVSSGLVGTAFGFPGLTATLIGTGIIDLRYPTTAIHGARFYPHVLPPVPSGTAVPGAVPSNTVAQFRANMANVSGQSGSAQVQLTTAFQGASSAAGGFASGYTPVNAPTGARINLLMIGSPIRRY